VLVLKLVLVLELELVPLPLLLVLLLHEACACTCAWPLGPASLPWQKLLHWQAVGGLLHAQLPYDCQ
jgi:hypothetical protein